MLAWERIAYKLLDVAKVVRQSREKKYHVGVTSVHSRREPYEFGQSKKAASFSFVCCAPGCHRPAERLQASKLRIALLIMAP